ncbi:hypothetical protein M9X92_010243 [Pyricularia oryzae]|nr:hypothetical protein M9X92_010243 [Pyricularia oryzae]
MTELGLSCPRGGQFYICQGNTTEFIGCCTVNPCENGTGVCPQANLLQASFSSDAYDRIPPQKCSDRQAHGTWWTCKGNTTIWPFIGCCTKDPCLSGTCIHSDLVPAYLSESKTNASVFLSSLPSGTMTTSPIPSNSPDFQPALAISGVVLSASVLAILIVAFICFLCLRHLQRASNHLKSPNASVEDNLRSFKVRELLSTGSSGRPNVQQQNPVAFTFIRQSRGWG